MNYQTVLQNYHPTEQGDFMLRYEIGGRGYVVYSPEKKCVLYCVVSRKEIVRAKEIVNDVDSSAFVIVSDVREVLGEGFLEYSDDF